MPDALIAGVHEFPERKTAKSVLEIQALSARWSPPQVLTHGLEG